MHILISHRYSPRLIREIVRSLSGSAMSSYSSKNIDDVELPPEPTTCCMSGCTNCVWVGYAEELVKLYQGNSDKAREIILDKVKDPNLKMFLRVELKYIQCKESLPK